MTSITFLGFKFMSSGMNHSHYFYGYLFFVLTLFLYYIPCRLIVNSLTITLGRLSFSIYLTHFMVIDVLKKMYPEDFLPVGDLGFYFVFLSVLFCSACLSFVTYKWIEQPGVLMGKIIIDKINQTQVTSKCKIES